MLLFAHASVVQEVKSVSIPLVARLPDLERREQALKEQIELSQLNAAVQVGSNGEKLDTYVMPRETSYDRIVLVFDLLRDSLKRQKKLSSLSEIIIDDPVPLALDGVHGRPLKTELTVHEDGLTSILLLARISGLLTVGDALNEEEIAMLLRSTEEENPAGITSLEQFLSSSLLRYSRDPRAYQDQLRRSFTSAAFERVLQSVTQTSLLRDAQRLFEGDFGRELDEQGLWPIQFMTVDEIDVLQGGAEGWYKLKLRLLIWEKE